jgi:hypothetical protein
VCRKTLCTEENPLLGCSSVEPFAITVRLVGDPKEIQVNKPSWRSTSGSPVTQAQPEAVVRFEIYRAGTGILTVGNLIHEKATP